MTLAELAVKLTANTAEFITGFSNAGLASKRFREDLSSHVQAIGGSLGGVLSHFGEFGTAVGAALDGASQSAGRAIKSFGNMGGAAGTLIGVGAGVAAAVGVVEVGMVGLAVKTALSIAKMGELAQSTGIAVGPLSGLSFVFKATGVEAEAGVKGIEKLDKAIFKAATSAPGAVNAFTRLGISVRDSQKNIKDADVVFAELAGKFEAMKDGSVKTALAMELFGKGGAALVPALNKGQAGIEDLINTAKVLGIYLDDQTVQAAEKFKESMATIEAATTGLSYNLTRQLLPALQTVATFLIEGLKDKNSAINSVINGFVFMTKIVLATADTIWASLKQIGIAVGDLAALLLELASTEFNIGKAAVTGDYSGAIRAAKDGYDHIKGIGTQFLEDSKKDWKDYAAFTAGIAAPLAPVEKSKKDKTVDVNTAAAKDGLLERIKARIEALSVESANWAKVASAGTQAEQLIFEAAKKSDEEFGKLKAEAAKSPAATALVIKDEGLIKAAAQQAIYGQAIKALVSDLDKQQEKFNEEGNAATRLAAAFQQGGAAIASAELDKKFADQASKLNVLKEAHDLLIPKLGTESPVVKELASAYDALSAKLQLTKDAASKVLSESLTAELIKQGAIIAGTKPYVDALNTSYSQGETAVRKARIELELYQFEQDQLTKGIVLTTAQKEKERAILEESDRQAYQGALAQEAAQFSLNAQYDSQITKLQRVREILQQNGQSTLLIDARLHDAQDGLLHQWDEAAFKVGSFSQKFKGVMGELVIQGRAAGQAISQAFLGAIDGIETNLAKLLTGQKTDFKGVAQGLAEQVTKAEIQKGVGSLAGKFGLNIPGLTGKPDGSSESLALWVKTVGAAGTPSVGSVGNLLSSFRSGSGGDSGGGFFSKLLSSFGGFKAGGGDMSPGSWYVAGERGPEIVQGPGSVIPNHALGGRTTNITHNHNYPSAQSRDLFGRTQQQNQARQVRNSRMAYGS